MKVLVNVFFATLLCAGLILAGADVPDFIMQAMINFSGVALFVAGGFGIWYNEEGE